MTISLCMFISVRRKKLTTFSFSMTYKRWQSTFKVLRHMGDNQSSSYHTKQGPQNPHDHFMNINSLQGFLAIIIVVCHLRRKHNDWMIPFNRFGLSVNSSTHNTCKWVFMTKTFLVGLNFSFLQMFCKAGKHLLYRSFNPGHLTWFTSQSKQSQFKLSEGKSRQCHSKEA